MFGREINTVDRAWERLVRALERVADGKKPGEVASDDAAIARFVDDNPGALEARLLSEVAALAARRCPNKSYPSMLGYLLNQPTPESTAVWHLPALPATFRALDPVAFLRFYAEARRQPAEHLGLMARHNSVGLAKWFALRAGVEAVDTVGLSPEQRDSVWTAVTGEPLPNILPDDLASLSPDAIARALAEYADVSVEALEARMRPGAMSDGGFLAEGESLGQVIHRDAMTLTRLGVSRHAIADRIEALIEGGPPEPPWSCEVMSCAGHQEDPFHSGDVYAFTRRGASAFRITNEALGPDAVASGGDLLVVLVRRACFFEGSTPYRLDPAHAAWVLGLTTERPAITPS